MTVIQARLFDYAIEGMLRAIQRAVEGPAYAPYYGDADGVARFNARYCMRYARHIGLLDEAAIEQRIRLRDRASRRKAIA